MTPEEVAVRPGQTRDIPSMQRIETAAGPLWRSIGMDDVADDPAHESDELAVYVDGGRAWVAERGGAVCAYALADVYDGVAHLEQVTVDPDHGRQGIGRRLIDTVAAWAAENGSPALTLITFRDVAWNGPYYRRLGFVDLPDDDLGPGLAALRVHEAELGLDVTIRCAMRLELPQPA